MPAENLYERPRPSYVLLAASPFSPSPSLVGGYKDPPVLINGVWNWCIKPGGKPGSPRKAGKRDGLTCSREYDTEKAITVARARETVASIFSVSSY
jgi:hypothetical protein